MWFAGVLALALFTTACSVGTNVTAEVDAAVAATADPINAEEVVAAVAATVEAINAEEAATPESTAACPFGFRDAPVGVQPDDLSCVDLGGFNLAGADFKGDDLSGSYMSGADLSNANLRSADLSGADLSNADLRNADLGDAGLIGPVTWSDTTCPDRSNSDDNGGSCSP